MAILENVGPDDLILLAAAPTWERMHAEGSTHPVQSYLDEGGGFERLTPPTRPRDRSTPQPPSPEVQEAVEFESLVSPDSALSVQSVLFPKSEFTKITAREWLRKYGFTGTAAASSKGFWHYRQISPEEFDPESYVTKIVGSRDVRLVLARRL